MKMAISRMLRTRFKIKSVHFLLTTNLDEVTAFLDGIEKLLEGE